MRSCFPSSKPGGEDIAQAPMSRLKVPGDRGAWALADAGVAGQQSAGDTGQGVVAAVVMENQPMSEGPVLPTGSCVPGLEGRVTGGCRSRLRRGRALLRCALKDRMFGKKIEIVAVGHGLGLQSPRQRSGNGPGTWEAIDALAEFLGRPASCHLNRRHSCTKKPAQLMLTRVALALAGFLERPQADIKSALD